MSKYTKQDIMRLVEEEDIEFIRLQFTDMFGTLKNVAITASQLEKALDNKCMFDGSSIEGFVRIDESDMYLYPDLNTFEIFPWRPQHGKVARMICDVYRPNGTPFEGDPRYIFKKVLKEAADMGYTFNVGPECEFFLFHTIDFKYTNALKAADNMMTFKLVVKTIAKRHGLFASFMPKPVYGVCGSGLHINMSLCKDGVNIFNDHSAENGVSKEAYQFIAGLMKHMKGMTLVANPIVNSYKRLIPGYEAPVHITWSEGNRSPLIRIPSTRGTNMRIELRSPDPAANPYLLLASCLAAGLDGIRNELPIPESVEGNIYEMSKNELEERGIEAIPSNLSKACHYFEDDEFMKQVLGEHVHAKYLDAKRKEWNRFREQVTEWEIEEYLYKI